MTANEMASALAATLNGSRLSQAPGFREIAAKAHRAQVIVKLDDGQEFLLVVGSRKPPQQSERALCSDCPPLNYWTDHTRCWDCPRRPAAAEREGA